MKYKLNTIVSQNPRDKHLETFAPYAYSAAQSNFYTMKPIQFAILAILAAVAGVKASSTNSTAGVCSSTCYSAEPDCGEESIPVKDSSDCWTCCTIPDDEPGY